MLKVILATAVLFGSFAFAEGDEKTPAPTGTEQTAPTGKMDKSAKKGPAHHGKHMEKKEKTEKKSE